MGPHLRILLGVIFAMFALICANSIYLVSVRLLRWQFALVYEDRFYLANFLVHLALGLLLIAPVIVFGLLHIRNARHRPNRRAVRAGYALFSTALLLFASGIVLMRLDVFGIRLELNDQAARSTTYWIHVICPLIAAWLFVLHRLAGRRLRWSAGLRWGALGGITTASLLFVLARQTDPPTAPLNTRGDAYFAPSLARTVSGDFLPERAINNSDFCLECHPDIHDSWAHSAHRFASFNNPAYLFSVRETRRVLHERDGTVQAARFCAGCHDPVPFFSGEFDHLRFDDPEYDLAADQLAGAGITCSVCHAITLVGNSTTGATVIGNADYTIGEPIQYPFTSSENSFLKWINRQLIKAKPELHKRTYLKPLHETPAFCGTCHKVHLPVEVNDYKWLRGQNHFDSFWLSGVSGQGVSSFYYPPRAVENCAECHMPLAPSDDFAARDFDGSGERSVHDHMFPAANTGLLHILDAPASMIAAHQAFLKDKVRVDLFGLREQGAIDGPLLAPLRPDVPPLRPGSSYLLEAVIRTTGLGHLFTQGTADSNEVWLEVTVTAGDRVIGRSGGRDPEDNAVDPWSHFVNAFVIDRDGNRINRRNAQDIFIALYDHQIPPGAADVVHYRLTVPGEITEPITVDARLQYRKFDTEYMRLVTGDPSYYNDLPITTLARDRMTFGIQSDDPDPPNAEAPIDTWERWNDYGIGLLRKGQLGELRQAAQAFEKVEALGRADGPLNLARVYIKEGLVQQHAPDALARAAAMDPPANAWSLLWFGALVAERNGDYDKAIANLREIIRGGFRQAEGRGFDFSKDYRVLAELANALYQRGLREKGDDRRRLLEEAAEWYLKALAYDPEHLAAHWGLKQVYSDLGDAEQAAHHARLHAKYKPDDNARDRAVANARVRYPAANNAAEAVVIYDLHREGAYGAEPAARMAEND